MTITLKTLPPDERVFGPPDAPPGRWLGEYAGPLVTCPGCGACWHGHGGGTCWACGDGRGERA
jgi:hypothetical protein